VGKDDQPALKIAILIPSVPESTRTLGSRFIDQVQQGVFDVPRIGGVTHVATVGNQFTGVALKHQPLAQPAGRAGVVEADFVQGLPNPVEIHASNFPGSTLLSLGQQLQEVGEGLGGGHGREQAWDSTYFY